MADEAIALTPTPFKVTGNHQKCDPRMRMPFMFNFSHLNARMSIIILNILTIISHNFDCLNKINK